MEVNLLFIVMLVGRPKPDHIRYILSVLPSLVAFFSLSLPSQLLTTQGILLLGFNGLVLGDMVAHRQSLLPRWYLPLRIGLTLMVNISMLSMAYLAYTKDVVVSRVE